VWETLPSAAPESGRFRREGEGEGEAAVEGCETVAGAGEEMVDSAVEGRGSRTKNWRGLSRVRNMLGCGLPSPEGSPSGSAKRSRGLDVLLQPHTHTHSACRWVGRH
jgi:hypothetical protein